MKLLLMGTSSWVIPAFDCAADEHDVIAVFTRAPKPAGRKQELQKSPVHLWAEGRGIPVYTNIKDFDDVVKKANGMDAAVVASYGVILKENVLNAARLGCINIHPSDLPKYRGPSPMATAVYNGDRESMVCLMRVTPAVDSGDVLMRRPFSIGENDTTADVEKRVGEMSSEMVSEFLAAPEKYPPIPQVGEPTYTRKFTGDDEIIDWSRDAAAIHNQVRAIGGRTKINGMDVKILETRVVQNPSDVGANNYSPLQYPELEIIAVQPAGKRPMDWKSFVNGLHGAAIEFGEGKTQKD